MSKYINLLNLNDNLSRTVKAPNLDMYVYWRPLPNFFSPLATAALSKEYEIMKGMGALRSEWIQI